MKKAFITVLTLFLFSSMQAQNKSDLYGKWGINNSSDTALLTLNKVIPNPENSLGRDWGRFIEFFEDGTYQENASAPCGMDDNRYGYSGKWIYTTKTRTIELSEIKVGRARPNIYNHYKVLSSGAMQITDAKENVLTVKITRAWEKRSAKK